MLSNSLKITCAMLACGALAAAQVGCACGTAKASCRSTKSPCGTAKSPCATATVTETARAPRGNCDRRAGEVSAALPPNARPGECYAKVFIPAEFKNVTERVLVRDASERIEIIPAEYAWVEEKVLVKDASTELVAVDAEFASRERTIQTNSGHTDWEINKNLHCVNPKNEPARDVFCLVNHPIAQKTIKTECQVKAAHVQTVCVPAQYETVRRQKLVSAATTRKICIPAEFENVEKTVKVCDSRTAWQRVICDPATGENITISANRSPSTTTVTAQRTSRK